MPEPARGTSATDEICQLLSVLTQEVKSLQDSYEHLERQVQSRTSITNLPFSGLSSKASPTLPVMMSSPEPRVPIPEKFSGDRSKFRIFRNACELLKFDAIASPLIPVILGLGPQPAD